MQISVRGTCLLSLESVLLLQQKNHSSPSALYSFVDQLVAWMAGISLILLQLVDFYKTFPESSIFLGNEHNFWN